MELRCKALALDAYGTIVRLTVKHNPFDKFEKATGIKISRHLWEQADYPKMEALARAIGIKGHEDAIRTLERESREEASAVEKLPETDNVIETARRLGLKLALVSNAGTLFTDPFIRLGLESRFDVAIYSCKVGYAKPDPRIYRETANRLGLEPSEIFMVGNHLVKDAQAARAAGFNAAWLNPNNKEGEFSPQLRGIMQVFDYI